MRYYHKKKAFFILVFAFTVSLFVHPLISDAKDLDLKAESAILVDAETGKILFAKNADEALPPASMTKMMTEYLVWEAIETGKIDWETTTKISDYSYAISGMDDFSGVGLKQNIDYTVKDLYYAMAVNSDNATTIALAELIAGSEGEFVKLMNQKGKEMGLFDFEFVNSTGLENNSLGNNYPEGTDKDGVNLLSAKSTALLAYHLVNDYPESLEISSMTEVTFDDKTITNWNWMLPHDATYLKPFYYEGVDGLKTGYTELAGNNFTGTVNRNGKRLITVVMNTGSREERFKETAKLMDYGYSNFETVELFPVGYSLPEGSSLPVAKGKEKSVAIALKEAVDLPIKKEDKDNYKVEYKIDESLLNDKGELIAPIEKGTKVGTADIVIDSGEDYGYILEGTKTNSIDLITTKAVDKKNWFSLLISAIGDIFVSLFNQFKGLF